MMFCDCGFQEVSCYRLVYCIGALCKYVCGGEGEGGLVGVYTYNVTPDDQTSTLKPLNVSKPFAISGG